MNYSSGDESDTELDMAFHDLALEPPRPGAEDPDDEGANGDPDDEDEDPDGVNGDPDDAAVRRLRRGVRGNAFDREAEGLVPTDGLAWADAPHPLCTARLLTIDDPRATTPAGFKGELFMPQKTLLAAMLALERCPRVPVEDPRCAEEWGGLIQTRIARVSEKFSFGKTVLSLALVCEQPVPARLPDQQPLVTYPLVGAGARCKNRANVVAVRGAGSYDPVGLGFLPEVTVRYSRFLRLTVVAAASNVISQWESETRRFTTLRVFIVENVHSLREFERMYHNGLAADLDLLFVKAGRVTTSFVVKGEPPHPGKSKNRSLFEALARILEGVPVARLIIDDYDTLKLGSDDCFFPALFTWLISATRRQTTARAALRVGQPTLEGFFRANLMTSFPILGAALDDVVNQVFSLHCAPGFVDDHISSTKIDYRRIYVRGGRAADILRDLEVPEDVIEMVNADAVGTAAQKLGIDALSIADVIHRVVGAHLDKLRHAVRTLARVAHARKALTAKDGCEKDRDTIKKLREALKDGSDAEAAAMLAAVAGPSHEVTTSLKALESWAEEQHDSHGKTLNRMRDNIREGHCQCCQLPFERGDDPEPAYILAGCCQIIVCEPCIIRKEGGFKKVFIKRCPNCLNDIAVKTSLVRVGAELDLEAALKDEAVIDTGDTTAEPAGAPNEVPTSVADSLDADLLDADSLDADPLAADPLAADPLDADPLDADPLDADLLDALNNPKLKALIQFIHAESRKGRAAQAPQAAQAIDCLLDIHTPPYVEGLLDGRRDVPWPLGQRRKFLVFTMHAESTRLIARACEALAIRFCILRGTRAEKDGVVRALREEIDVMLVTAAKDCGGLNLPQLSHIIFYHRILDRNVEAQVAARGQRLGREGNLEIVTFINEAEAEGLPPPAI
jgi:hypothetical protein